MNVIVSLDSQAFTVKPQGAEIGTIRNRLSSSITHKQPTLEQLGEYLHHGYTIQGALLRDKQNADESTEERFLEQQLYYVDIDNKYKEKLSGMEFKCPDAIETFEEILTICREAGVKPCIIYESFTSGTKDSNGDIIKKFHVIFAVDEHVTDFETSRKIIKALISLFPTADKSCSDPARILYGTSPDKPISIYNEANSIESLLNCSSATEKSTSNRRHQKEDGTVADNKVKRVWNEEGHNYNADPNILLQMIDTNTLSYDEYFRVTASFKAAGGAEEVYYDWADKYVSSTHSQEDVLKQNRQIYKSINGTNFTIGTLIWCCKQYAPDTYNAYIATLKSKGSDSNMQNGNPAAVTAANVNSTATSEQVGVEEWKAIKPFDKEVELPSFPMDTLPKVLCDYVEAVATNISVYNEMCILPMLSTLSLCLQGKAKVQHPGTHYEESINLYCLTIADSGSRKSSAFKAFMKPVWEYENEYNTLHKDKIDNYMLKRRLLSQRIEKAINSSKGDSEVNAMRLQNELSKLEKQPFLPLELSIQDSTPEALVAALSSNKERTAIMSDEATIFNILNGSYSKSRSVNFDILLHCYDGTPYSTRRRNGNNISLSSPLVTIGCMIQPHPFRMILDNPDIIGKGLLQRFIFALPKSKSGYIPFEAEKIPDDIYKNYKNLVYTFLKKDQHSTPKILKCTPEAKHRFKEYHESLQEKLRANGIFNNLKDFANKQFAKVLRIASLIHLCEHSEDEFINELTVTNAIKIGLWLERQAIAALESDMISETEKNAKFVLQKLKTLDTDKPLSQRDICRKCRKLDAKAIQDALEYLDDMNVVKYQDEKKSRGRIRHIITINPDIKNFPFE